MTLRLLTRRTSFFTRARGRSYRQGAYPKRATEHTPRPRKDEHGFSNERVRGRSALGSFCELRVAREVHHSFGKRTSANNCSSEQVVQDRFLT